MSEWISVEERLPPTFLKDGIMSWSILVLTFDTHNGILICRKKFVGKDSSWVPFNEGCSNCRFIYDPKVTHWMPLPETPK